MKKRILYMKACRINTILGILFVFVNPIRLQAQTDAIIFEVQQNAILTAAIQEQKIDDNQYRLKTIVDGGYPEYTYNWYPVTGLDNPKSANPVLQISAAANKYYLEVTDSQGCSVTLEHPLLGAGTHLLSHSQQAISVVINEKNRQLQITFADYTPYALIKLCNMQGQELQQYRIANMQANQTESLHIKAYETGIYLVCIKTGTFQKIEKIILKNNHYEILYPFL